MSASDVLVLLTHIFVLPALWYAPTVALRGQIFIAVVVSLAFHAVENSAGQNSNLTVDTLQRLDHATSSALIATVLLQQVAGVTRLVSFLVLLSGLAASSLDVGNFVGIGVTALAFLLSLLVPKDTGSGKRIRNILSLLTLGGDASSVHVPWNKDLTTALILQITSALAYVVGEWVPHPVHTDQQTWARGWHSVWHAFAFLALWALLEYVRDRERTRASFTPAKRAQRNEYKSLLAPRQLRW
jgi:hypothetical protein